MREPHSATVLQLWPLMSIILSTALLSFHSDPVSFLTEYENSINSDKIRTREEKEKEEEPEVLGGKGDSTEASLKKSCVDEQLETSTGVTVDVHLSLEPF